MTAFVKNYYRAQLPDYLHLPKAAGGDETGEGPTLLSLKPEDVATSPLTPHARDFLNQKLEETLLEQCLQLLVQLKGTDGDGEEESASGLGRKYDRVSHLPDMVRAEREAVEANREAKKANASRLRTEWKDVEVLLKSFDQLMTIAKRYKMGDLARADELNSAYLVTRCETLNLKLKCLEMEVVGSTYKPERIKALRKISAHLEKTLRDVNELIAKSRTELAQFEAVDEDFSAVVREYTQLKADIEGKLWALKELKKEKSTI